MYYAYTTSKFLSAVVKDVKESNSGFYYPVSVFRLGMSRAVRGTQKTPSLAGRFERNLADPVNLLNFRFLQLADENKSLQYKKYNKQNG